MSSPVSIKSFDQDVEILDEWVGLGEQIARLEAQRARLIADRVELLLGVTPVHQQMAIRCTIAEFAAAGRVAQGTVERAFGWCWSLVNTFPETYRLLTEGAIFARHAEVIVREAGPLTGSPEELLREYEAAVTIVAIDTTATRTQAHARQVVAALLPETMVERHRRACEERTVTVESLGDGMAKLCLIAPEVLVRAAHDRVTAIAKHAQTVGRDATDADDASSDGMLAAAAAGDDESVDERTLDQRRADVAMDLLLASTAGAVSGTEAINATVQVTVRGTTLAGLDDAPAELDGYDIVDPDLARFLAGSSTAWTRLFLDPQGMVCSTDAYPPTAGMQRFLRARDRTCRFPGCRAPARRCQIDHTLDHAKGGPTHICNLECLCGRHHPMKHPDVDEKYRWNATQLPGGILAWTSPSGDTYIDEPPPRVMFA